MDALPPGGGSGGNGGNGGAPPGKQQQQQQQGSQGSEAASPSPPKGRPPPPPPLHPLDFANDGYAMHALSHHLVGAGRLRQLRECVSSPAWLEAKLHLYGVAPVVDDFRR